MSALDQRPAPGSQVAGVGRQRVDRTQAQSADSWSRPKRVLMQFRAIANALKFPVPAAGANPLLTDRRLSALGAIAHQPGLSVNGLAGALGVRQPTASQRVKALAALQLVTVHRDGHDRRGLHLHASTAGLEVLRAHPPQLEYADRLPRALAQLDEASLHSLESGLAELVQALAEALPAAASTATNMVQTTPTSGAS